ncbi:ferredoxin [Vibrio coralliilyticus]|uniref:Ferredoxin-type protein NapF n=1 Tax=Vibrio coralliilyticus TaxID=190893 RepID=A0A837G0N3_9VIBR|nr:ferredoxin-type protein NapF [Vibrio coralliilyticus]KJY72613.1 ferredoxin [Vibrio coralliilyticus]QOU31519.1 ferredoxin-type protein NapF [Vibrio coralliilyticus]
MVDLAKRRFFSTKKLEDQELYLPWLSQPAFFTDQCTRCGKCADACETQIIVKGDGGFPRVDFSVDECTFCYQCADACPEPLFNPKTEQPWNAKATINESCLAKQNVDCRTCGDMCEPMAITFKLEVGKVAQPILNLDECNACGACVSVCPTSSINVSNF